MKMFVWLGIFTVICVHCPGAEVVELGSENFDSRPGGKEADSIAGDFVLRSKYVEAVISGDLPLRRANMSAYYGDGNHTPGCLYDLTPTGKNNDQLTVFSPCLQKGDVSSVTIDRENPSGTAAVKTYISAATSGKNVAVTHEYRVSDSWNGILISTTFDNQSDKAVPQNIYDHWTQMRVQGSTKGIRWADAIDPADKCGYAFAWVTEGGATDAESRIVKRSNRNLTIELAAGETLKIARFLAVGNSPAEAIGLVAEVRRKLNTTPLTWQLSAIDKSRVTNAKILFPGDGKAHPAAYPDAAGKLSFPWFVGSHPVEIRDIGRETVTDEIALEVNKPASKTTQLPALSSVQFSISADGGDTPCKIQFAPRQGTAKLNLGPSDRAHGCVDQWHSEKGKFTVPLPAGEYQVTVTRGPEFSRYTEMIALKPGETIPIETDLKRVIDSTGWVSTDFHNHSTPSGDNTCGTDDRLINLAAEHIEFAPTTEHNRLYDWKPHIDKLKLDRFVKTVAGMELTGRGAHINCFPLTPEPMKQDSGAPVWNKDPRISSLSLENWQKRDPDRWIHLNHPDMSENFVDRDRDGVADGGFAYFGKYINALETQNYRNSNILSKAPFTVGPAKTGLGKQVTVFREFIWLQLLNQGMKVWGIGVADAHHVHGNGVGSWRTYLPCSTDNPAEIDWREISRNARKGQMVLSSGPYLEVETEKGTIAGGEEVLKGGKLKLNVKVQCPDWMKLDRVQVLINGRQDKNYNYTIADNKAMFKDGVVRFDESLSIELREDTHIIVVAAGENGDLISWFGTSSQGGIRPCAYNNPIFIDIDGNGFQPNGDTLGFELPVGRLTVQKVEALLGNG
ncbi:MAG: CehA/McbA family metallohydrolase [Verrucomicrobiales bacterium]|nr:CehA/McbA family metallohydrolase [Verrucomicrobiales bacterium]